MIQTAIHVHMRIWFLSSSTLSLIDSQLVLEPRFKMILMSHNWRNELKYMVHLNYFIYLVFFIISLALFIVYLTSFYFFILAPVYRFILAPIYPFILALLAFTFRRDSDNIAIISEIQSNLKDFVLGSPGVVPLVWNEWKSQPIHIHTCLS